MTENNKQLIATIWDWPLRLFHWLLVIAVVGAYLTGDLGGSWTDWHDEFGGLVLGLLVFRLLWGFIGSQHAQFRRFFPTPERVIAYWQGRWQGVGHNPFGAIAVITLLGLLSFLVVTGLFANDDIAFEGPLFHWVDKDLSDKLSGWHDASVKPLLGLVALHLSAIVFYQWVKKINLIWPMLSGKKQLSEDQFTEAIGEINLYRFIIAVLMAVFVVWSIWKAY